MGEHAISQKVYLQEIMKEILWIPNVEIRKALEVPHVDETSENIGAITGLFFEQVATAFIVPALRQSFENIKIERNKCSDVSVRAIARDPDLYAFANNRHAVVEFKVSPKKRDLEYVLDMHEQYIKKRFVALIKQLVIIKIH